MTTNNFYSFFYLPRDTFCPEKIRFCYGAFLSKRLGSYRQRRVCGKTAPRAGKAVITPARRAWVRAGEGGGRREITLAAGARLWQGDSRRRFRTDRRMVSAGQPDAR